MATEYRPPTVRELVQDTGLDRGIVDAVVRSLERHGLVVIAEGGRIKAGIKPGMSTTDAPAMVEGTHIDMATSEVDRPRIGPQERNRP